MIALTDEAQAVRRTYAYDDWGNNAGTSGTVAPVDADRARWKGALWMGPELDLYYMRNRWYEPATGRFLSEDPIGLLGGINPAVFSDNDPVGLRDPSGLGPCKYGKGKTTSSVAEDGTLEITIECPQWPFSTPLESGFSSGFGKRGGTFFTSPTGYEPGFSGRPRNAPARAPTIAITCATALPNGQTVGDVVRQQRAVMQRAFNGARAVALAGEVPNPLGAMTGTFFAIGLPKGPLDFKNNFRDQAEANFLGQAGNFAYFAVGSGFLPVSELDAGASGYAVVAHGALYSPNALVQRKAGLAANGCQ